MAIVADEWTGIYPCSGCGAPVQRFRRRGEGLFITVEPGTMEKHHCRNVLSPDDVVQERECGRNGCRARIDQTRDGRRLNHGTKQPHECPRSEVTG